MAAERVPTDVLIDVIGERPRTVNQLLFNGLGWN